MIDENGKLDSGTIDSMGKYIQDELTSEMSTPEMVERNSKLITLLSNASTGKMKGKKVKIHRPFSKSTVVHDAIVAYFEQYDVSVDKKY